MIFRLFSILSILFGPIAAMAQTDVWLNTRITVKAQDQPIVRILEKIKTDYKIPFAYNKQDLPLSLRQTLMVNEKPLRKALAILFKGTNLDFSEVAGQIVVRKKPTSSNGSKQSVSEPPASEEGIKRDFTVSGYISDHTSGESLIGVTVRAKSEGKGAISNEYGFYALSLPQGQHTLVFSYIGFEPLEIQVDLQKNVTQSVCLGSDQKIFQEVVISARSTAAKEHVNNTEMSKLSVPMEILRKTPALFGESDIIKAFQLMPGVKRGGEGTTGMFVRGGGSDENLILLDEAPVYNPGHILGFLSVFNSNALRDVSMYKGAFPAQYGGRLSGIMDVKMREGNDRRFSAQGGIGNIASSLTLEGPIKKERGSFIISGRRSYIDKLVAAFGLQFPFYFYDLNLKANYRVKDRDRVYVSSYFGRDVLDASMQSDSSNLNTGIDSRLGNFTATSRWNHIYKNEKLFHNLTILRSQFNYKIEGSFSENNVLIQSAITDYAAKLDYDYRPKNQTTIKFGGAITHHIFKPNLISVQGDITDVLKNKPAASIDMQELALYGSLDHELNESWKLNGGLRLSGAVVQGTFYKTAEPRLAARYAIGERNSLKFGYARMAQYMHLVSSSSVALPTDLWYPVTKNVKPGYSDQVSTGWFTNFFEDKKQVQFSTEVYYKWMHNLIEYREGARLILNDNYESELIRGRGRAWGFEMLIQKNAGKLTGWIGYTLAWSNRTFSELNKGATYFARYDRRHDVSVVANYEIRPRFSVSLAWVYSSGNPFTPIVAKYLMPLPSYSGIDLLPVYPAKNSYRLNDSHRLDIDFVFKGKKHPRWQGEWHLGAYNAYNRTQPNRVVIRVDPNTGRERYEERGLFGMIGSISYNFKF